ncbi:MAG: hypothetical protein AAB401_08325, partial [Acidobacteriota bacterium]
MNLLGTQASLPGVIKARMGTQASLPAVIKARSFRSTVPATGLFIFTAILTFFGSSLFKLPTSFAHSKSIQSKSWPITLEEPTGIYRRDNEVVTVKLNFVAGEARAEQLRVLSPDGREVVSQVAVNEKHYDGSIKSTELMFPATIVPGERPEFRLVAESVPRAVASGLPLEARSL